MSLASDIKKQIVINLQALISAGILNSLYEIDLGKDPLQMEPTAGYPFAILGMPTMLNDYEDQLTNRRTYVFNVLIVTSYEALPDQAEGIEILLDAIASQFDNNFTLAGAAVATVLPVEISSAPVSTADKAKIAFLVTIKAQTLFFITNTNP